ncbi:hypothetical protein B0A49_06711, partial [Cryomyces minteri]
MGETISEALGNDHKYLDHCYEQIKAGADLETKTQWRNQLTWALARHAISDELTVKEDLNILQNLSPDDPKFDPLLERLMQDLRHHIEHESNEDMPRLEKALSKEESQAVARSFQRTKMITPTRSHPSAPNRPYFENVAALLAAPIDKEAHQLTTTTSHIFCISCSDGLGLSNSNGGARICPACETHLINPDDAVVTQLNPTEDYKTSVLSGLSPGIIMECAGRGLAFYSYQTTQEIVYQEFLAKSLTEKYSTLSSQMDKIINDANAEITNLREKLSAVHTDQKHLEQKNHELVTAYKEKSRSQQQIQKLYQSLKSQVMASHVQTAASDDAENTLQTVTGSRLIDRLGTSRAPQSQYAQFSAGHRGAEQIHSRQRSSGSGGITAQYSGPAG